MLKYAKNIMKMLKTFFLILLSFSAIFSGSCQTAPELMAFAEKQFSAGNYPVAIREFQRILFFTDDQAQKSILYNKLGGCYYQSGQFAKAAEFYEGAHFLSDQDSAQNSAVLMKVRCFLHLRNYTFAQLELSNLKDRPDQPWHSDYLFLQGITEFGLEHYQDAETCFLQCIPEKDSTARKELRETFHSIGKLKRLNPKVARWMSLFLPGSGQIYGGKPGRGINSLVLTGSLVYLFYWVSAEYTLFDAFLSVYPWFQRYYAGGIRDAGKVTENRKNQKKAKLYSEILTIIADPKP
jgi:tetratricopeptide (TPR) repeat protein